MEEKTMFPCGSNEEQKVNENVMTAESSSEVSGGVMPGGHEWVCCGMVWLDYEKCGKCGKSRSER